MYQFIVVNERTGVILNYASSEAEANTEAEGVATKWGSHRISVWSRQGTLENERVWKR
jgi:hypothetical protein